MAILKFKRLLKSIARGNGKSGALDRDFRQIIRQIPLENKRDLILQYGTDAAKRRASPKKEDGKASEEGAAKSAHEFAEEIEFWPVDFPPASTVLPLKEALTAADPAWIKSFRDAEGVSGLCGTMEGLAESRDLHLEEGDSINPMQVPQDEVELEEAVVRCLMVLLNKETGLSALSGSANLWPVIARSAMDSTSDYVRTSLLKVLTVMVELGQNGSKVVLNALDVVKAQKNKDLRFSMLVEALANAKDSAALPVAVGVTVFLNTVLYRAVEFEERVLLRGEMIEGGMLQAVADARSTFGTTMAELFADSDSSDDDEGTINPRKPDIETAAASAAASAIASATTQVTTAFNAAKHSEGIFLSDSSHGSATSLSSSGAGLPAAGASAGFGIETRARSGFPSIAKLSSLVDDARVAELKKELNVQLDLFDRVTDEDALDAIANGGIEGDDGLSEIDEEDEDNSDEDDDDVTDNDYDSASGSDPEGPSRAARRKRRKKKRKEVKDSQAVKTIRAVTAAVEEDEAISAELELIADKLGVMGRAAGCGPELWRRVRDAATEAAAAAETPSGSSGSNSSGPTPSSSTASPSPSSAIPAPPPMPGNTIPAAPPMPMRSIPAAPPMPMSSIPAAPPMPISSIPAAPPMPAGSIPAPPPMGLPKAPPLPPGFPPPPNTVPGPPALPLPRPGGPRVPTKPKLPEGQRRRGLHWKKITTAIKGTVFEELKAGREVEVPKDLLMEGFAEKPKVTKKVTFPSGSGAGGGVDGPRGAGGGEEREGGDMKEDQGQEAPEKKKAKMELLGAKTLQYAIVFKTVSVAPETVRDAVISMDLSFLNPDTLEKLGKLQPQPAELATLKAFKGEVTELVEVERFMVLASQIPSYVSRLRCASIMQSFQPDAAYTSGRIKVVQEAIQEVEDSAKLKRLLAVVLAVGNFLNEGTFSGAAEAITLESLLKLETVRRTTKRGSASGGGGGGGGGGEDNLLHALMEWASESEPDLLLLGQDLSKAASASRLSLDDLKREVVNRSKELLVLEVKVEEAKKGKEAGKTVEGDRFVQIVEPFLDRSKETLEKLRSEHSRVEEAYASISTKFGENPKTTPNEEFFDLIKRVVAMVNLAIRQNQERADAEAARIKREARAKKRKKPLAKEGRKSSGTDIRSLLEGGANRLRRVVAGTVNSEYDRIKEERERDNEAFRELDDATDADERQQMRDQLHYQRSTTNIGGIQRAPSTALLKRALSKTPSNSRNGGLQRVPVNSNHHLASSRLRSPVNPSSSSSSASTDRLERKASSALQQASMIKQTTALRQASFVRSGSRTTPGGGVIRGREGGGGGGGGRGGGGISGNPAGRPTMTAKAAIADSGRPSLSGTSGRGSAPRLSRGNGSQAVPGLRLRGLQVPDVGNEGDAGGEDDGDWDGDDSPKVARGALSKRLMDTRKTSRLDSRRGPIM